MSSKKYLKPWEPGIIEVKILARGTWWYDGEVPYQVELVRRKHNYDSSELETIYSVLTTERDDNEHGILTDYINWSVNKDGYTYIWMFGEDKSPNNRSFSTYHQAREFMLNLGKHSVDWPSEGTGEV